MAGGETFIVVNDFKQRDRMLASGHATPPCAAVRAEKIFKTGEPREILLVGETSCLASDFFDSRRRCIAELLHQNKSSLRDAISVRTKIRSAAVGGKPLSSTN